MRSDRIPSEVLSTRESRSRPEIGIVKARTTGFNHRSEIVIIFERTMMIYKKGYGPDFTAARPQWDALARKALEQ